MSESSTGGSRGKPQAKVITTRNAVRHRVGDCDSEAAGEMVVTGAGAGHAPIIHAG